MSDNYSMRKQRDIYMITVQNDMVLKAYPAEKKKVHFDQLGVCPKVFKNLWRNYFFRVVFNIALPFIMLFFDFYFPIKYSIGLIVHKKKCQVVGKRLFLSHDRKLYTISKRANLQCPGDVWYRLPWDYFSLPNDFRICNALDFVSICEVLKSSFQSILLHFRVIFSLGYDKYFLSFKAYEWCLTDFALRHVALDVELVFSCICDRMSILYDNLPHKNKTLIQHGTMHFVGNNGGSKYMTWNNELGFYVWNSLYKSSPSTVYCYTPNDKIALSSSVIANSPNYIYITYGFKPTFKPSKKSILIVGNIVVFERVERGLLEQLQDLDIDLYLKGHPVYSDSLYNEYRKKYRFHYIEGLSSQFPDVDLVISYDSTLAFEYASIGTKVIYFERINIEKIRDIVIQELKLI